LALVNSVLGPIETSALGTTLAHEHLLVASGGISREFPDLLDAGYLDLIVDGLKKARAAGINTVVDATTFDLGRDINVIAEASRRSGVNVIACTGWWLDKPRYLGGMSVDQFAGVFVRDIEVGIAGTNIKAGVLKAASDIAGVTPEEEVILRAVARAHHRTGVPIMLHSYAPGQVGRRQLDILKAEGVNMRRVKLDHSNDTTDVEYLTWVLDQGCFLGLDRYPFLVTSTLARTRTMKALMDAGYSDRLCPSHDWSLARVRADGLLPLWSKAGREQMNPHLFCYIHNVVFPQLREMGVSQAAADRLLVNGIRNFFEGG